MGFCCAQAVIKPVYDATWHVLGGQSILNCMHRLVYRQSNVLSSFPFPFFFYLKKQKSTKTCFCRRYAYKASNSLSLLPSRLPLTSCHSLSSAALLFSFQYHQGDENETRRVLPSSTRTRDLLNPLAPISWLLT